MAEVASLVLGILPLGLQLVREVRDYLSAIEQRAFDLEAAATEIDILEHSLKTVNSVVSQVALIDVSSKENIARVCDLVQRKVKSVSSLVKDITADAVIDKSLLDKAKARTRILLYPYKKENLTKLQTELRSLNALLDSALRPLDYAFQKQLQSETHALVVAGLRQVESSVLKTRDIMVVASEMAKRPSLLAATASRASVTNADVEMASSTLDTAVKAQKRLDCLHRSQAQHWPCRCRKRVLQKRKYSSHGPVLLISEELQEFTHLPACKFRKSQPLPMTRSYRLGWRFENDQKYMATVLALAINVVTTGRGEWSLSSSIQAFNHIDLSASPLLRLADLYRNLTRRGREQGLVTYLGPAPSNVIKGYWRCSLKRLLQEGKASPLDLDSRTGATALHKIATRSSHSVDQFFWDSVRELGIPNHILDGNGSSAWEQAYSLSTPRELRSPAWLLPPDAFMPQNTMALLGELESRNRLTFCHRVWRAVCRLDEYPEIMEDQLITPFLRAIITRSKGDMLRMLLEGSQLEHRLREEFRAGQIAVAAVDLIMMWFPLGAAALVDLHHRTEARPTRAGSLRTIAASSELPLLWSLLHGFCFSRQSGRTTEGYLDAISISLQLDCAVPNSLFSFMQWEFLALASARKPLKLHDKDRTNIITHCASHLANRRRRLTQMARQHLGQQELQVLGLLMSTPTTSMLEGTNAAKAWQMLLSKGLSLPTALDPCLGNKFHEAESDTLVYSHCFESETAELLFQAGHTPDKMVSDWVETGFSRYLGPSAYVAWLLTRCAYETIASPIPDYLAIPGKRNVHLLSAELGKLIASEDWPHRLCTSQDIFKFLTSPQPDPQPSMLQYESEKWADSCDCFCSVQGCTPLIDLIKQAARYADASMNSLDPEKTLACVLWHARSIEASSIPGVCSFSVAMAFMRVWSFELLECRHTCCKHILSSPWMRNKPEPMPDQEEREEIHEEDGMRLSILEKMQKDMEHKWLSSQNYQLTLAGFVRDEWWPALVQARQQIEADAETLEEAIRGMESVGVKAGPVPFLEEGPWILDDETASEVASIASEADEDEREQWEQKVVLAHKRLIDRVCDWEEPANGATTERGRWTFKRRYVW